MRTGAVDSARLYIPIADPGYCPDTLSLQTAFLENETVRARTSCSEPPRNHACSVPSGPGRAACLCGNRVRERWASIRCRADDFKDGSTSVGWNPKRLE